MSNYQIVKADNPLDLEERVEHRLRNGWEPAGGVSVLYMVGAGIRFYQAMITLDSKLRSVDPK